LSSCESNLNPELRKELPLNFKKGEFDLVGEVVKMEDKIIGYFKPMLEDAKYLGNKKEFKNVKQLLTNIFTWSDDSKRNNEMNKLYDEDGYNIFQFMKNYTNDIIKTFPNINVAFKKTPIFCL
jgi:hypothetical protein